ncbi:helix-turn-helix domain-containing protein [Enterococcus devriesei]|uniref:helix-turn-helix domain-containing protein n=1 Tax=Enterococcus devriesei TaxID=319970 RepID=UPI0036D37340
MYNYFMSKKELVKVNLFKYILLTNSEVSIQTIMKRIKLSKSTSLRYVSELGEDLLKSFNSVQLLIDEQGNYFIQKDKSFSNSLTIETLKEFYVRKSTLFQVFSAVMQKENLSIKDLEVSLELAPSTIYNKLAVLNDIAKTFKGKISFTQSGNIEGDEIGIRFFSYYLIWMLNKTNKDISFSKKMPIEFLNLDNLKRHLITTENLSASQEKKLKIAQGLTLYRLLYRRQFIHLDKEFLEDIQFFNEDHFSITKTSKWC